MADSSLSGFNPMSDPRGYLTKEQVDLIMTKAPSLRDYMIVRVLYRTGCRPGELVRVKWADIDFENSQILMVNLKRKGTKKGTKVTPIDGETRKLLNDYREYLRGYGISAGDDELVFPFTTRTIHRIVVKCASLAGIEIVGNTNVSPKMMRHSLAVRFAQKMDKASDLPKLQKILGHSSISTTQHYLRFSSKEVHDSYDQIWDDDEEKPKKKESDK